MSLFRRLRDRLQDRLRPRDDDDADPSEIAPGSGCGWLLLTLAGRLVWWLVTWAVRRWLAVGAVAAAVVAVALAVRPVADEPLPVADPPAEPQHLFGWAGPQVAAEARARLAADLPELRVSADVYRDTLEGRFVGLWSFAKWANGGQPLAASRQEIGDCVSWGFSHAADYSLATLIGLGHSDSEFSRSFPPYVYGISRVQIGGGRIGCRSDGSVGSWAAKGLEQYGILSRNATGVPAYSGRVAKDWGCQGPPQAFRDLASKHKAECRLVTDWESTAGAILSGWPVAICSNVGFNRMDERDGRLWGVRSGTWPHCMCLVGVDTRAGSEGAYCLNSWGPTAHGPLSYYERTGEPAGGFWVRKADVVRIVSQGDSYAVSFTGFAPPQFGSLTEVPHEDAAVAGRHAGDGRVSVAREPLAGPADGTARSGRSVVAETDRAP